MSRLKKTNLKPKRNRFEWEALKAKVLAKANYTCQKCGYQAFTQTIGPDGQAYWVGVPDHLEVDHIQARALGGKDEEKNLQVLCKQCHRKKTNKDVSFMRMVQK